VSTAYRATREGADGRGQAGEDERREAARERAAHELAVLDAARIRCREQSVRHFAMLAGVHYPHLTEVLAGRRKPSQVMLAQMEAAVRQTPSWASARDLRP
jgi:hypothetical protein